MKIMDLETVIPVSITCVRDKPDQHLRLNITTGSLELDQILSELDKDPVDAKSLDTSLDSGLKKHKKKVNRRRQTGSRMLLELKSDLGPSFAFPDTQNGNLRSKYGRLQKVKEAADCVPSDVFRMKKSPQRSPPKAFLQVTVKQEMTEKGEETKPLPIEVPVEESRNPEMPLLAGEFKEEAMDVDEDVTSPAEVPLIREEELIPSPPSPVEEIELTTVKQENLSEPLSGSPPPSQLPHPEVVTPLVKTEDLKTLTPIPAVKSSLRISLRKQSMGHSSPKSSAAVPAAVLVVKEEPADEVLPRELSNGIFMSPSFVNHERFTAIQRFKPGMMIWGLFAKYPPWPCLILEDPNGVYLRQVPGLRLHFQLHVRFFGPKGLCSWISQAGSIDFDPDNISEELREGSLLLKNTKPITEKISAELNWAIEDAQIVAAEQNLTKRADVFQGIVEEQNERWKSDQEQLKKEAVKRRRSSIGSNSNLSFDGTGTAKLSGKKRIKLSIPVIEVDASTHSFSSALSSTSSSGVSTMGKLSDTLSVSSAGLGTETDEDTEKERGREKPPKASAAKKPEVPLEESLSALLKAIPSDVADLKRMHQGELCRNCTKTGMENDRLVVCNGPCGGLYHVTCLDSMAVSQERLFAQETRRSKKRKSTATKKRLSIVPKQQQQQPLVDEGVELDGDEEEEGENSPPSITPRHVTGETRQRCRECRTGEYSACFICHKSPDGVQDLLGMTRCTMSNCGRSFHMKCLDQWPQTKKSNNNEFICPHHQCHLCISDDPKSKNFKQTKKLYKCILCPTAYHLDQNCMPAGTEVVGAFSIICQRHFPLETRKKVVTVVLKKEPEEEEEEEENNNNNNNEIDEKPSKPQKPPKHRQPLYLALNVNWCFICAQGGSLLCCDQCPSAFHLDCLKLNASKQTELEQEQERFLCEECELGRFPLYGELVWAKFGNYRWWPSVVVSEGQVPLTLLPSRRNRGEFCIKFLGSNDYAWIGRRRVFLYHNDDAQLGEGGAETAQVESPEKKTKTKKGKGKANAKTKTKAKGKNELVLPKMSPMQELMQIKDHGSSASSSSSDKNGTDTSFRRSLLEARVFNGMLQERKTIRRLELSKSLRPVQYYKLKSNLVVPPVKLFQLGAGAQDDLICKCVEIEEPGREGLVACGPSSECLNRLLLTECNPAYCPGGERCDNQRLQRREYPSLDVVRTENRGWGLIAKQDLKEGDLVVEYVGELINNAEMRQRIEEKEAQKSDVYYFLTLTKDLIIDAERKGNMARFMNHSCDPNCVSEKWTVNGNTRVGLFARMAIKANTELTFNYHWESTGASRTTCRCGAKKCKGFIGGDSKRH